LYQPRTAGPHPVLIDIHDGPAGQFRPGFDAFIQFAVNQLGYVVIAPNIPRFDRLRKPSRIWTMGRRARGCVAGPWRPAGVGGYAKRPRSHPRSRHGAVVRGLHGAGHARDLQRPLSGGIIVNGYASLPSYLANGTPDEVASRRAEFGDESDPQVARAAEPAVTAQQPGADPQAGARIPRGCRTTPAQVQQSGRSSPASGRAAGRRGM